MFWRSLVATGLILIGTLSSHAHDPGLSSAKLALQSGTLRAVLTFAPGDIEAISNGEKPDLARLESFASQSVEIWFDERQSLPIETKARLLANKDVEFELLFHASPAG